MILRAKIVVPVSAPPIENGAVEIRGNEILRVGRWEDKQVHTSGEVLNLGDVILLPGLVNAHCHLDYTGMAGKVPPPRRFSDWVRALVALKATSTESDYAESWKAGAKMLLQTGTTTVYDIEAVPTLIPAAWQWTPLRVISFRELIALRDQSKTAPFLDSAVNEWRKIERQDRVGLSPHAPYTTTANVLHFAANAARKFGWPLTT